MEDFDFNWEEAFESLPLPENDNLIFEGDNGDLNLIEEYLMKDDNNNGEQVGSDVLKWLDDLVFDDDQSDLVSPLDNNSNSSPSCSNFEELEGNVVANVKISGVDDDDVLEHDDPLSKKRKRQLRNRDAAMKSRERKKVYVKDLETKSRYLEAECRRLGRLLQCCYAENQMLRISLGSAYAASMTKPESAVLLLESLLLVSLVWLMACICLPKLHPLNQGAVPHASVGERKEQESAAPNRKGKKVTDLWVTLSFTTSKRCRGSRIKMKYGYDSAVSCF